MAEPESKSDSSSKDHLLGYVAVERDYVTPEQLSKARDNQLALRAMEIEQDLGVVLSEMGLLTEDQLQDLENTVAVETGEARLVAGYEVISKIGQGGMGAVYKAKKLDSGEFVALKILLPSLATKEFVNRFRRESEVVQKLHHENIVGCVEFGKDPKRRLHFCALEFVEGENLSQRIERKGVFTEEEATSIMFEIARALQHAYYHGLVHRDIKPENIMVTPEGRALLLDLGLARPASQDATRLTQSGMFVGSPHYASPEQARTESDLDIRSDIYSLGATLYFMVTGRPPFEGETVIAILQAHVYEKLQWPAEVNPDISESLCLVITKMMAKDPGDRYQTPIDLLRDLDSLKEGRRPEVGEKVREGSTIARLGAVVKRRPRPPTRGGGRGRERERRPDSRPRLRAVRDTRETWTGFPGRAGERAGKPLGPMIVLGAAAALVVALGVVLVFGGKEKEEERPKLPPVRERSARGHDRAEGAFVSPQAPARTAGSAFKSAEDYEREHPEDIEGTIARYEAVATDFPGTPEAGKARVNVIRLRSLLARRPLVTADFVRIEAEAALTSTFKRHVWYDGQNLDKSLLSGDDWLSNYRDGAPPEATFEFEVAGGGEYVFWLRATQGWGVNISYDIDSAGWRPVARKGRSEFANQVGGVKVGTQHLDPRSVAWTSVGRFHLEKGKHSLRLMLAGGLEHEKGKNSGAIDCMCFTRDVAWIPSRVLKPGERPPLVEFGGHRYRLFTRGLPWHEAKAFCERLGGHLVTITSKQENDFVTALACEAGVHAWIGFTDEGQEGKWRWVTGEKATFTAWDPAEPNNRDGREHWAHLSPNKDYAWNDDADDGPRHRFICEWEHSRPHPPAITSAAPANAFVGHLYSYTVRAVGDPEPTLRVTGLPPWLTFDGGDTISGTPGRRDAGTTGIVTVTATNAKGSNTQKFPITVVEGCILREYWTGIGGGAVVNLTGNPNYPDNPSETEFPGIFEGPTNWRDNYGTRIHGFVRAPLSGAYTFWIASDDSSELWLSTDSNPANVVKIAAVPGWTGRREWAKYPSQQSRPIVLRAGEKYYVMALHKEKNGSDNIAVGWQLPDGTFERPIPEKRLSPWERRPGPRRRATAADLTRGRWTFKERRGTVVIEAENFTGSHGRTDPNGVEWRVSAAVPGYVGDGYVDTPGPRGTSATWADGCGLSYKIEFSTAGAYNIWMRVYLPDGARNSAWVGIDGTQVGSTFDNGLAYRVWRWVKHGVRVGVTTGLHTFNIRRREGEYIVDRVVLTTDGAYIPSGNGPPESGGASGPRSGTGASGPAAPMRPRAAGAVDLTRGLVGHWKLDERRGAVARDSSGEGNHGVIHGARRANGKIGGAAEFDGVDDKIDVPYSAALNPDRFSFALWVKPKGGSDYRSPLTCRDGRPQRGYMLYVTPAGVWSFWIGDGTGYGHLNGPPVGDGRWQHVACTYDGAVMSMYVDGTAAGSTGFVLSKNTARPLRIGAGTTEGSGQYFFPGSIDDVRIYDRALSAAEIAELYRAVETRAVAAAPPDTSRGLVGHWKLDEGQGTVARDSSGNGHHGKIYGPAWAAGRRGKCLQVTGSSSSSFSVPSLDGTRFPKVGSLSMWIWLDSPLQAQEAIFDNWDQGRNHVFLRTYSMGKMRGLQIAFQSAGRRLGYAFLKLINLSPDQWHHLVVSWDTTENTARWHVDGAVAAVGSIRDASWIPDQQKVVFGAGLVGRIDEICIYNRALSAEEVKALYDQAAEADRRAEEARRRAEAARKLDALLRQFYSLVAKGAYRAAARHARERAVGQAGAVKETLEAVARVARSLERRREAMETAAHDMLGREVTLKTKAGPKKGVVEDVSAEGIRLVIEIRRGPRVLGRSDLTVPWGNLTPEQEDSFAREWRPQTPADHAALALVALVRDDAKGVEAALTAAGDHPLADWVRGLIERRDRDRDRGATR